MGAQTNREQQNTTREPVLALAAASGKSCCNLGCARGPWENSSARAGQPNVAPQWWSIRASAGLRWQKCPRAAAGQQQRSRRSPAEAKWLVEHFPAKQCSESNSATGLSFVSLFLHPRAWAGAWDSKWVHKPTANSKIPPGSLF